MFIVVSIHFRSYLISYYTVDLDDRCGYSRLPLLFLLAVAEAFI